jgi:hypothetical protein
MNNSIALSFASFLPCYYWRIQEVTKKDWRSFSLPQEYDVTARIYFTVSDECDRFADFVLRLP